MLAKGSLSLSSGGTRDRQCRVSSTPPVRRVLQCCIAHKMLSDAAAEQLVQLLATRLQGCCMQHAPTHSHGMLVRLQTHPVTHETPTHPSAALFPPCTAGVGHCLTHKLSALELSFVSKHAWL